MNIAMIISNPFPPEEGIGYYTYNLSKKLMENEHNITVITRRNNSVPQYSNYHGINILKANFLPIYPFHVQYHGYFVKKLFKKLNNEFDLIHIHSPLSPVISTDIPIIGTIHTSLMEDIKHFQVSNLKSIAIKLTTYTLGHSLIQKLIDKSKFTTTVSAAVATELLKYYNIKRKPIVVGNGVDINKFFPIKDKDNNYILYVGRLDYRKGIFDLIKAATLLDNDIDILIAGEGPLNDNINKYIKKNNIYNIKLLGHISGENLVNLYQNALMFIFPSHYEGLPTVLLEAMSCGLPVITTEIPAHRDLINDYKNGLFIKKGSPTDIVQKINLLKDNEKLSKKLGINARKTIEKNFTWDIISKKFEGIYKQSVLNGEIS